MHESPSLKNRVAAAIEAARHEIIESGTQLWAMPETGYREVKTARFIAEQMRALGLFPETGLALTGVRGVLDTGRPGPTVAVLAEMDSILLPDHPDADPGTGAVHGCGHFAQSVCMLGVLRGLRASGILPALCGRIVFLAVPAEEGLELDWRVQQIRAGRISFLEGKPQLIKDGAFDDVDLAIACHLWPGERRFTTNFSRTNGIVSKRVTFHGKSVHAAMPKGGVNALKAATIAFAAIDALRECWDEEQCIRVHGVITNGGEAPNVIPSSVRVDMLVRAIESDDLMAVSAQVDRALKGAAMSVGAGVTIESFHNALPRLPHTPEAVALLARNTRELFGEELFVSPETKCPGSTDLGDLSHVVPLIEFGFNGAQGTLHGADYQVRDPVAAFVDSSKLMAALLVDLLGDGGTTARKIIAGYPKLLSKREYLTKVEAFTKSEELPWRCS